jgi:hypothetical protein
MHGLLHPAVQPQLGRMLSLLRAVQPFSVLLRFARVALLELELWCRLQCSSRSYMAKSKAKAF